MADRFSHERMADELEKILYSRLTWLADFSEGRNARPPHEIEQKRVERDVLKQARDDYRAAAKRKGEAA